MDTAKYLGGKAEIAIGHTVIGPEFLTEIAVDISEGTRTTESLAGNITQPSGMFETAQVTGSFILPSMDALKRLYAGAYQSATGEATDLSGRVVFGGNNCQTLEPLPVNIHYTCEGNSDNDVHIYAGLIQMQFTPTYNQGDNLTVNFTILAQPTANGYGFAGAGDLTQKTLWNATTLAFEPIASTTE